MSEKGQEPFHVYRDHDGRSPIHVIGLGLPGGGLPLGHPLVPRADVLVGGKAVLDAFAGHPAEKMVVDSDTATLYARMEALRDQGKTLVVLCSGDPLFFGLGARLAERFGASSVRALPGISSLQAAASLAGLPWEGVRSVSLHGREAFLPLARALNTGEPVFVLCDRRNGPAEIAAWMLERGCGRYRMLVFEDLSVDPEGLPHSGHSVCLDLDEVAGWQAGRDVDPAEGTVQRVVFLLPFACDSYRETASPSEVVVLSRTEDADDGTRTSNVADGARCDFPTEGSRAFGLDDAEVSKEEGLITKLPVRAAGLGFLGIGQRSVVWDLGAGSGAVSIEAARLAWQGQVFAVEKNKRRIACIVENRRRFGVPNLEVVQGVLPDCLENGARLARPDRIFIGGGLGRDADAARRLLSLAWKALLPGGRLLAHCILLSSLEIARSVLAELAEDCSVSCIQASCSTPLAGDVRLEALNPVFLVLASKNRRTG